MPAKRTYQPQPKNDVPTEPGVMPVDCAVAVYYRQSSMKQVGNISTDMQQIDLPRYVKSLGWAEEQIILIDEDEGVSGSKRIDERVGMSRLYNLIITGEIGTVAVQAEDRLFRDETQIQVNVFIDACVKNDVRVLTPYFKYNFADKHEGPYHRLLFRMRAEQAADFLNSYVRGRLVAAKERMMLLGMWMGGNINLGFMVDNRKYLPSGIPNPNWRKVEADRIWSRLRVHYTPTHGSWLNMAEIEIGILSRQCLRRRLPDAWSLATEVIAWEQFRNAAQAKIHWSFTVQDACHVFHTDYSRFLPS